MKMVKRLAYLVLALIVLIMTTILWIFSEILTILNKFIHWIDARLNGIYETFMIKADALFNQEIIKNGFKKLRKSRKDSSLFVSRYIHDCNKKKLIYYLI